MSGQQLAQQLQDGLCAGALTSAAETVGTSPGCIGPSVDLRKVHLLQKSLVRCMGKPQGTADAFWV